MQAQTDTHTHTHTETLSHSHSLLSFRSCLSCLGFWGLLVAYGFAVAQWTAPSLKLICTAAMPSFPETRQRRAKPLRVNDEMSSQTLRNFESVRLRQAFVSRARGYHLLLGFRRSLWSRGQRAPSPACHICDMQHSWRSKLHGSVAEIIAKGRFVLQNVHAKKPLKSALRTAAAFPQSRKAQTLQQDGEKGSKQQIQASNKDMQHSAIETHDKKPRLRQQP